MTRCTSRELVAFRNGQDNCFFPGSLPRFIAVELLLWFDANAGQLDILSSTSLVHVAISSDFVSLLCEVVRISVSGVSFVVSNPRWML